MFHCLSHIDPHLQNYAWSWGRAIDRARQMLPLVPLLLCRSLPAVSRLSPNCNGGTQRVREQLSRRQLRAVKSGQCLECAPTSRLRGLCADMKWKQISWISLLSKIRRLENPWIKIAKISKNESDLCPFEWCLPSINNLLFQFINVHLGGWVDSSTPVPVQNCSPRSAWSGRRVEKFYRS